MINTLQFSRFGDIGKTDRESAHLWIAKALSIAPDEMLIHHNTEKKQHAVDHLRQGIAWANYSAGQMLLQALEQMDSEQNEDRRDQWRDVVFSLRALIRNDARSNAAEVKP